MAIIQTPQRTAADDKDLWEINPQTGQLYSSRDRRLAMAARDESAGVNRFIGGPMPSMAWDNWYDALNQAAYDKTGKTPDQLTTKMVAGPNAADVGGLSSNQLRGLPTQTTVTGQSIATDPRSLFNNPVGDTGPFGNVHDTGPFGNVHDTGPFGNAGPVGPSIDALRRQSAVRTKLR